MAGGSHEYDLCLPPSLTFFSSIKGSPNRPHGQTKPKIKEKYLDKNSLDDSGICGDLDLSKGKKGYVSEEKALSKKSVSHSHSVHHLSNKAKSNHKRFPVPQNSQESEKHFWSEFQHRRTHWNRRKRRTSDSSSESFFYCGNSSSDSDVESEKSVSLKKNAFFAGKGEIKDCTKNVPPQRESDRTYNGSDYDLRNPAMYEKGNPLNQDFQYAADDRNSNLSESSEVHNITPLPKLEICLEFKKCFEEDPVDEIVTVAFEKFQTTNLHLIHKETELLMMKNKTKCHFTIYSDDISLTIDNLKLVVNKLKKDLQVHITYHFEKHEMHSLTSKKDSTSIEKLCPIVKTSIQTKHMNDREHCSQGAALSDKAIEGNFNSHEKQKALKVEIQKASKNIEKQIMEILQRHDEKIDETQRKVDSYPSEDSYPEFMRKKEFGDKDVISQKLNELQMQRSEFVLHCNKLCKDLESLDPLIAKQDDVSSIQKSIGIEYTRLKRALPIYARRKDIVDHVGSNQVSIILGETGSGKSTQLPQYIYEAGFATHGSIICTQPRRIAAITLAERVANEMVENVGKLVGYKAGIGKKCCKETKMFFTTDHSLLNECLKDPELKDYSCIIVDEAHERSIYTDILLGMIKIGLQKRPDLKIIITSATIDPEVFIKYFNCGPELRVSGRNFPVEVHYVEDARDDFENYEEKAVSKAIDIHRSEDPGDVLIFLSSPVEIIRCCEEFEKRCHGQSNFKCFPLHGQLPPEEQKKVFEMLPKQTRKIVFATNCAETSITIDGIKYVIDTGVAKEMKYDSKRNMNQLGIHAISKSSSNQRKGRAGRTASGKCYRLYSKDSFEAMESISDPEILRVHLGQAVLKLCELGVDIKCYDFVQAPSETALNSAINTLEYLGAIKVNQITEIGKWISKLPFDPKLGYVVYEAAKGELLYDAIVLVSVLNAGSDLFFRGFTESEAQTVAKTKIDFGSEYGDPFTWLRVYKAWTEVNYNDKKSWCKKHCINHKCITFVHQSTKDVRISLARDQGIQIVQQFSEQADVFEKLRKILFKAHAHSISNFSGVARGGYFSLIPERQVYLHPSSILSALNLQPEWIIYTNLVRTSKEFIKGITVVEEEWVKEIVDIGKLDVDFMKVKENKFYNVHHEEVGQTIFRALVGPYFSNLQVLEEELLNSGLPRLILEARRDLGVLDIHSPFSMTQCAINKFNDIKSSVTERLLLEDFEFPLNKKESVISSGTRIVIGRGGCVKSILMPNQSDKVIIKKIHPSVTEEDILTKFRNFGEIKDIVQFKCYDPWGFVRYGSTAEALSAVEATSKDEFNVGMLKLNKHANHVKNMFEAKLTWIRRPIKGKGTAFVKCSPLVKPLLIGQSIMTMGRPRPIKVSDKGDLIIFSTGNLMECDIKDEIMRLMMNLSIDTSDQDIEVSIAREVVSDTENDINALADCVTSFIKKFMKEDGFKVSMRKPKKGSIYYVCFVSFMDPMKGYDICRRMTMDFLIKGNSVEVNPCLKTIVHVPAKLKVVCEERFKTLFAGLAQYKGTQLTWKEMKKDFAIEIKSSKPEYIVEARDLLCKEMDGEVIDCSVNDVLSCLLNKVGQDHLKKIEKDNSCVIITDFRSSKIHLYGTESRISKTQQDINSYLTEIDGSEQVLIQMRGYDKPPGLMKRMMHKYGHQLEGLVNEFKLRSVNINWKKHSIQLIGSKTVMEKVCQSVKTLEQEAWRAIGPGKETDFPDCSVCICPIEQKESLFRLEVCGHAYCLDCLQHQTSFAINNKEFPLVCAKDECDSPFVWKDIKFALSKKWIREDKLVSMAVNSFVLENKEKYKFCLTPNCPVVYEITTDENGREFNCPLCFASICTTCHIAFHAGMSCLMAKSGAQAEGELSAWVEIDPSKRKLCPGCHSPIEKIEGCNKMHCTICKTYFCWLCRHISPTEDECYKHLRREHNGYF